MNTIAYERAEVWFEAAEFFIRRGKPEYTQWYLEAVEAAHWWLMIFVEEDTK